MANLTRGAKSGNEWTQHDLQSYNIRIVFQDAATFFGRPLPQPTVHPDILTVQSRHDATKDYVARVFMADLEDATAIDPHQDAIVQNFVWNLLRQLGYQEAADGFVGLRRDIQFIICGQVKHVKVDADIKAFKGDRILLLVQEDKRRYRSGGLDPEPQLIVAAIAAFSKTNTFRVQALGLPALEQQTIPGITITGSMPTFYKIPVTTVLAHAIEDGQYPAQETVVYAHLPVLPRPQQAVIEGMVPLDNRHIILSYFKALKQFLR